MMLCTLGMVMMLAAAPIPLKSRTRSSLAIHSLPGLGGRRHRCRARENQEHRQSLHRFFSAWANRMSPS